MRRRAIAACTVGLLSATLTFAEPLLSCGVRQPDVESEVPEPMETELAGIPVEPPPWEESYMRSGSGEWISPSGDDPTDKRIQSILWTPNGPIAIQVEVTIDSVSFRQVREQLVETAEKQEPTEPTRTATFLKDATKQDASKQVDSEEVSPTYAAKAGLLARLKSHFRNRDLDRDEANWLLNEWIPGPTLISVKSGYAAERSHLSPVFTSLDADKDGRLSPAELQQTQKRLLSFDKNENEVIELDELGPKSIDAIWYPANLFSLFGPGMNTTVSRRVSQSQYDSLPAIELRVSFGKQKEKLRLELARIDTRIAKEEEFDKSLFATDDALVIERPRYRIEFVALQTLNYAESHGQISMGAVVDGSPVWRELDQDGDGRLERRERVQLDAIWKRRDLNRDGMIEPAELRSPIRMAIGCGPQVHLELANPVPAITKTPVEALPMPDWFTSMDLNKDSDVSRSEFIGTDEQFSKMDSDGNDVIGSEEILTKNK